MTISKLTPRALPGPRSGAPRWNGHLRTLSVPGWATNGLDLIVDQNDNPQAITSDESAPNAFGQIFVNGAPIVSSDDFYQPVRPTIATGSDDTLVH